MGRYSRCRCSTLRIYSVYSSSLIWILWWWWLFAYMQNRLFVIQCTAYNGFEVGWSRFILRSVTWLQPARNIPLEYAVIELKLNRMEISVEFSCVLWIWWYLKRTETSGSVVCPRWQWRHHCFLCYRNGATVNVNIQIDSAFHSLCQSTSNGLYSHNFDFRLNNINWRIDRMERRSICARAKIGRARVCALLTWTKTKKLISNFTTSCTNCSSNAIDVPNYLGPRQPKTQFCYS